MNVTMVTTSISRDGGGMTPSIRDLSLAMSRDCEISVVSLKDTYSYEDAQHWHPDIELRTCHVLGPATIGYAPSMLQQVTKLKPTLIHRHGLWNYPSRVVSKYAISKNIPYVVSVHGMLNESALQISKVRKAVFGFLAERPFLQNASCIHALSYAEAQACRNYGLNNPIAVIPNGINAGADSSQTVSLPWSDPHDGRKVLLYIGRLHPIKGLPLLIKSFAKAAFPNWRLVIAGWDQNGHRQVLEALVASLDCLKSVEFVGPVHGDIKEVSLRNCDAFALPSTSEAQPVAVQEAWARGVPAILTEECNLPEATTMNMSVVSQSNVEAFTAGLLTIFNMSDSERASMGQRALDYTRIHYCWDVQAQEMLQVYLWLISGGPRPSCVLSAQ